MEIRFFDPKDDYQDVCSWWKAHKWPNVPLESLSGTGAIVHDENEKYCAAWLYQTDSDLCWLEWVVSNPGSGLKKRAAALNLLIETLTDLAGKMGKRAVWVSLENENLIKRYQALGYKVSDTNMTNLMRVF